MLVQADAQAGLLNRTADRTLPVLPDAAGDWHRVVIAAAAGDYADADATLADLVQRVWTNNADTMKDTQVRYGLVCGDDGGILDEHNAWRLCPTCNDLKTYRGWRVVGSPGQWDLVPPDPPDNPDPPGRLAATGPENRSPQILAGRPRGAEVRRAGPVGGGPPPPNACGADRTGRGPGWAGCSI